MKKTWVSDYHVDTGISDVIPEFDLAEHIYGRNCFCKPNVCGNIISHHSLDGREEAEKIFNVSCNIH